MVVAEFDAAFFHALEIPAGVVLFLFESVENALSKGIGRVGEFEQGQSHELDGKEFVVGEKVEEDGSLLFVFDLVGAGEWRAARRCCWGGGGKGGPGYLGWRWSLLKEDPR
jgi:hypothetical protein